MLEKGFNKIDMDRAPQIKDVVNIMQVSTNVAREGARSPEPKRKSIARQPEPK